MKSPHLFFGGRLGLVLTTLAYGADRFGGFPPVGKHRPGDRSAKVLTSDALTGVVRPKWTRAMGDLGDLGGWPAMFRFQGTISLVFPHVDGHRGKRLEGTGKLLGYASRDEGKTWTAQPPPPQAPEQGTPEYVVAGDKLYSCEFNPQRQTLVRVSGDGKRWSEPQPLYKPPFYAWGVMYDPVSKRFWAPPHAIPSVQPASEPARTRTGMSTSEVLPATGCDPGGFDARGVFVAEPLHPGKNSTALVLLLHL